MDQALVRRFAKGARVGVLLAVGCLVTSCGSDSTPDLSEASRETGACLGPDLDLDVPAYGANSAFQGVERLDDPDFESLDILEEREVSGRPGRTLRLGGFPGISEQRANGQVGWVIHEDVVERLRSEAAAGTELYVRVWLDAAAATELPGETVLFVIGRRSDGSTVLIGDCAVSRIEYLVEPVIEEFGDELDLSSDLVEFFTRVADPDDGAHRRYLEMVNEPLFNRRDQ